MALSRPVLLVLTGIAILWVGWLVGTFLEVQFLQVERLLIGR